MMTSTQAKIETVHVIAAALKKKKGFSGVSVDSDHKDGEVIFTGPDGVEYVIKSEDIKPRIQE